jgi:hypothetical protein
MQLHVLILGLIGDRPIEHTGVDCRTILKCTYLTAIVQNCELHFYVSFSCEIWWTL